jgi:hypothetical protein
MNAHLRPFSFCSEPGCPFCETERLRRSNHQSLREQIEDDCNLSGAARRSDELLKVADARDRQEARQNQPGAIVQIDSDPDLERYLWRDQRRAQAEARVYSTRTWGFVTLLWGLGLGLLALGVLAALGAATYFGRRAFVE